MADNFQTNAGSGGNTFASDDVGGVHYPISKLGHGGLDSVTLVSTASGLPVGVRDSNSVGVTSIADGAGQVGLTTAIGATNFVLSSGNSSTAQLAAAATFTGTIETIYNQQAISVLLTSDQNGTLTLRQYIDAAGTRPVSAWAFPIVAGVAFSRCFTGNGNYFNLTFQNTGGSTTTTLNINTAYGTLPAVTNLGYMPVSINEVGGTLITAGQNTAANSIPVVLASNVISSVATPQTSATFTGTGVIAINTDVLTVDCINATGVSIQCSSFGASGVITPAWSNDGANFVNGSICPPNIGPVTTFNATGLWTSHVLGRYLRLRMTTAQTSGTTTLAVQAIAEPIGPVNNQVVSFTQPALVAGTATIGGVMLTPTAAAAQGVTVTQTATATGSLSGIKASAGNVYGIHYCAGAAAGYVMLFDATALPGDGTVTPKLVFPVASGGGLDFDWDTPKRFGTGISACFSSTGPYTKTLSANGHLAVSYT